MNTPSRRSWPRAALVAFAAATLLASLASAAPPVLPEGYMSGVVKSSRGPEAGVWVIAETKELQTPFVKIVVTGDDGRFVLPQLPDATYNVWVRGYGLVDSDRVKGRPGDTALDLTAKLAATPADAAKVYPGNYWLSLLQPPAPSEFPGTGPSGNGIPPDLKVQGQWINNIKSQCNFCHQLGGALTRSLGHMDHLGFKTPEEAWIYRTQLGVRGSAMAGAFAVFGVQAGAKVLADWTTRIANGELPPQPPRPAPGPERNVVVTLWDWGNQQSFMHDEISTDKNDPTVNGYGPVYAASAGHGRITVLDPIANSTHEVVIPTREDPRKVTSRFPPPAMPSNFWGMEHLWGLENPADPHNPMMDRKGRVWATSKIRNDEPAWCREGSNNKFAKYYPLNFSNRQASVYNPATGQFKLIDTCFATHHLQFDNDADQTLYFNELLGPIVGWLNTREYDRTGDEQASQGWCPQVVDTNGDGKITKPWNKPGETDARRDTEVRYNLYSIIPSPVDGSVWGAAEDFPGYIVHVDRGTNPPDTCITEVYKVPEPGIDPRGIDIDSSGIVWTALAASSHLASFDISKCKVRNGPTTLAGTHCAAGWKLYVSDGPRFKGTDIPSDFHYYNWVDQHDVAGFGRNTPMATGSNSDAILVLDKATGKWTKLRVPYPLGFYHRGMDGRIDDPTAGWKGRGLWANYGTHLIWHVEGGKGTLGKAVHFQIRPDTLAH